MCKNYSAGKAWVSWASTAGCSTTLTGIFSLLASACLHEAYCMGMSRCQTCKQVHFMARSAAFLLALSSLAAVCQALHPDFAVC